MNIQDQEAIKKTVIVMLYQILWHRSWHKDKPEEMNLGPDEIEAYAYYKQAKDPQFEAEVKAMTAAIQHTINRQEKIEKYGIFKVEEDEKKALG